LAAEQTNDARGPVTKPGKNSTVLDLLKRPRRLLSWPASFRENQSPCVRRTTKQTCQFERLTTLRTRRHPPRKLQSVGRAGVPIKPVDQVLRRFFAHRSVELLLPGLVSVLKQQDSSSSGVYSHFRICTELPAVKSKSLLVSIGAICGRRFRSSLAVQSSGPYKDSQPRDSNSRARAHASVVQTGRSQQSATIKKMSQPGMAETFPGGQSG
jgi:hypothetical protein